MTMRYLEGLSAAAASALAISVGFVMWLSWRSPAQSVVVGSNELRYPPMFWDLPYDPTHKKVAPPVLPSCGWLQC